MDFSFAKQAIDDHIQGEKEYPASSMPLNIGKFAKQKEPG
jgi:hypothetical protein